jgi:hypothetical protein
MGSVLGVSSCGECRCPQLYRQVADGHGKLIK